MANFTTVELLSFLDEALPQARMAAIEQAMRDDPGLIHRLAVLRREHTQSEQSLGDIWRQARLTCPTRPQLGSYLLEVLDGGYREYLDFHLNIVGCRYCLANLEDLRSSGRVPAEQQQRRQKFFQSSAGYMNRMRD